MTPQVFQFQYAIFQYIEEYGHVEVLDVYKTLEEAEEALYDMDVMTEAFIGTMTYTRLYPAERTQLSDKLVREEIPAF